VSEAIVVLAIIKFLCGGFSPSVKRE